METINKYPSICWECENARKTASEELQSEGYCGCCIRAKGYNWDSIGKCEEVAIGWVDLKSEPFGHKSGVITNFQIIANGVIYCDLFERKNKS